MSMNTLSSYLSHQLNATIKWTNIANPDPDAKRRYLSWQLNIENFSKTLQERFTPLQIKF